jgi:hypothetical protein
MTAKNPYYGKCIHQKWIYAKKIALCNSYSKVRCMCNIYRVDVYTIHRPDDNPMCCVSLSYYTKQNCQYFKNKNNQTQLGDF